MATTGLKLAYEITGNKKVKALYDKWVDKLGYRDPKRTEKSIMGGPRSNYDDTDHLVGDLYLLNLLEKDPDLLRFYRKCVRDSWDAHKGEKLAWFNYVYRAVLGDECGDPEGSVWYLQTFPTCRIFQPQMNSLRTDIEFTSGDGRKEALHPLPVNERSSDNEYEWKNSPFSLDGWTARIVSIVEVSPHDPYVMFAADTSGTTYRSLSKGELWHAMGGLPRVNDFLFSPDYPWIAFAATPSGVYGTSNGGESWSQRLGGDMRRLKWDPENSHVLYAVGAGGVFKSADLGERSMGTVWTDLTAPGFGGKGVFAVDPRGEATVYMQTVDGLYSKLETDVEWRLPPRAKRTNGFSEVEPVGGKPVWLRVDDTTPGRLFRGVAVEFRRTTRTLVGVSEDGGETWSPVVRQMEPLLRWASSTGEPAYLNREELGAFLALAEQYPIEDVCVDAEDPRRWYGRLDRGVAITEDAGQTWHVSAEGLDIPRVQAMWKPRESSDLYVGTPAGLYVSRDGGETWQDTSLIPQGAGVTRSEIGGVAYLTAYWMARYHGFIDDAAAREQWWK